MKWEDFCAEFKNLTVCHLDDHHDTEKKNKRIFRLDSDYVKFSFARMRTTYKL